jgi:hypothetical protein
MAHRLSQANDPPELYKVSSDLHVQTVREFDVENEGGNEFLKQCQSNHIRTP